MRQIIFLLFLLPVITYGQTQPSQEFRSPFIKFNKKAEFAERLKIPGDTTTLPAGATIRDTSRLIAFGPNGNLYKLWNGVWEETGGETSITYDFPSIYIDSLGADSFQIRILQLIKDSAGTGGGSFQTQYNGQDTANILWYNLKQYVIRARGQSWQESLIKVDSAGAYVLGNDSVVIGGRFDTGRVVIRFRGMESASNSDSLAAFDNAGNLIKVAKTDLFTAAQGLSKSGTEFRLGVPIGNSGGEFSGDRQINTNGFKLFVPKFEGFDFTVGNNSGPDSASLKFSLYGTNTASIFTQLFSPYDTRLVFNAKGFGSNSNRIDFQINGTSNFIVDGFTAQNTSVRPLVIQNIGFFGAGNTSARSTTSGTYRFRFNTDSSRFEGYNGSTWRGIAWSGEGGGGGSYDPANVILNQYAAREAKRLWVDTAYGRVVRADTFATNNIPPQYSLIFNNGRLTGTRSFQNNGVGARFFQRTVAEGYVASDLIIRGADSSGSNQTYAVRWDGRTTIGSGTTTNFIDVYGTQGGFNNTNIRVKTSAANGDSRLISENSGSGRVFLQATSSSASILANQGSLLVENLPKFEFMTDGQVASGGTAPFIFKAGGYGVSGQLSIHPSNQLSINMGSTVPNAALIYDVGGTTRATRPWSQLTTAQMNAISSPPPGSVIYNTTENAVMTFDGTRWTGFRFNGTKFQGYQSGSGTWVDLN